MSAPLEIATPHGPARVHFRPAETPRAALLLGHGAGGLIDAPDLLTVTDAALGAGVSVALVEQPYRVGGRRAPAPADQLDRAWVAVAERLATGPLAGLPLVAGGRSSGARVACRTAAATGAAGVLCLAFPLRPVPRAGKPKKDRSPELDAVAVPVLVVQGARDPFGMPRRVAGRREVTVIAGNHALTSDPEALARAVSGWLSRFASRT